MRPSRSIPVVMLLLGALIGSQAWAHGRSHHGRFHHGPRVGLVISGHFGNPWFYSPPPAYFHPYPTVIDVPSSPPVYIEQRPAPAQPQTDHWYYYCSSPDGYYPYVRQCPGGWQKVPSQPPS